MYILQSLRKNCVFLVVISLLTTFPFVWLKIESDDYQSFNTKTDLEKLIPKFL